MRAVIETQVTKRDKVCRESGMKTLSMYRKTGHVCQKRNQAPAASSVFETCFHGRCVRLAGRWGNMATRHAATNIHVATAGVPGRSSLPRSSALASIDASLRSADCPNRKRTKAVVFRLQRSSVLWSGVLWSSVHWSSVLSLYHFPRTLLDNWRRDTYL